MFVDTKEMISACKITSDSKTQYYVVYAEGHDTLKPDDIVVMAETPSHQNVFIRSSDMTIHTIDSKFGSVIVAQRFRT